MAWQKLIKFQKYARKIFMHIIYTYILTGVIHIYIYTRTSDKWRGLSHSPQHDTHPHADPQRNRRRCGVCFPQSTIVREFISSSRVSASSAPPRHLLCIFSTPPLHLLRILTMSSVSADCVASLAVELFTSQAKPRQEAISAVKEWPSCCCYCDCYCCSFLWSAFSSD